MSTLLLRLAGDPEVARRSLAAAGLEPPDAELERGAAGSPRALAALRGAHRDLAVLGEPPDGEIGYWIAPLAALASGARRVVLIDGRDGEARVLRGGRYLARALPLAGAQAASLPAALAMQSAAARALRRRPPELPARAPSGRVVYLRATIGTPEPVGGSVTHTHEVIRALRALGHEVGAFTNDTAIAATAAAEPEPPCEWNVVAGSRALRALPASAALGTDAALVLAALDAARQADFIYQRHARFSICGALLSRLTGTPLVLEFNGSEVWTHRHWQSTPLMSQLARCEESALASAARIVVISEVERRRLVDEQGIDPERVLVNPNGVDVDRFARGDREAVRGDLGLSPEEFTIGFVGTFGPWHGAPVLARAFAELAGRVPRARLLLIGDGPQLAETLAILRERGAGDRVIQLDRVPPAAMPDHLAACDALASPHVWNPDSGEFFGSPTKLFEYMAAGRPVVASRLGQIGAVLDHERTGLLVEPGDAAATAAAFERLAGDPGLGRRLGEAAQRTAAERHSWRLNAQCVVDAYRSLAPATGSAAAAGPVPEPAGSSERR